MDYKKAGVDIDKADKIVDKIKEIAHRKDENVIGGIGNFGALYKFGDSVLVSGTDGVGTKLKVAFLMDRHDTVGIDLVAMNVNDIITKGAKPLFFLDYISSGKLKPEIIEELITGIVRGCDEAGCSLIGGETAEMPDFYSENEYDLVGFVVGAVKANKIIDGTKVKTGNKIVGIKSSGLHSNGFSLIRKLFFDHLMLKVDTFVPELGKTLGEELLTPTRIYSKKIQNIIDKFGENIQGMAHITGGGFLNIRRINEQKGYVIDKLPEIPAIFNLTQEKGNISSFEMFKTFNMGVGFVIITDEPEKIVDGTGEDAEIIGYVDDSGKIKIKEKDIVY